jgi:ComF family protein
MNLIFRAFHNFVDFFYPPTCLVCGDKINLNYKIELDKNKIETSPHIISTEFCCSKCKSNITFAGSKDEIILDIISNYEQSNLAITNAVSLFKNSKDLPIINLIYGLKYRGYTRIGLEYGEWLGEVVVSEGLIANNISYNYIVPVPIHKIQKRERGFNQSDFIARGISKVLDVEIVFDLLKRIKYTSSQTQLDLKGRLQNMENAFVLNKKYDVAGKKILLVDDVLTTGSTLNNCALILLENKAKQVDIATLLKS